MITSRTRAKPQNEGGQAKGQELDSDNKHTAAKEGRGNRWERIRRRDEEPDKDPVTMTEECTYRFQTSL